MQHAGVSCQGLTQPLCFYTQPPQHTHHAPYVNDELIRICTPIPCRGALHLAHPCSYDTQRLQGEVAAARAAGPDLVVVMIHWGPNWRWQPDQSLRQLGRDFLAAGADLVFGTSPHHIQVCDHLEL